MSRILKLRMLEAEKKASVVWTCETSIKEYYLFKIRINNLIGLEKIKNYMRCKDACKV